MSEPTPAPAVPPAPAPAVPETARAAEPGLPTAAQLDRLEADLDHVDAVLARLDEER
jgi:hypothetical protein